MNLLTNVIMVQAVLLVWMGVLYGVARLRRDAGFIDVGWAAGIGVAAVFFALLLDGHTPRQWLVATMAGFWSIRLSLYILQNRIIGRREDARYARLRAHWGRRAEPFFFLAFQAEGVLVTLFCVPLVVNLVNPATTLATWEYVAIGVWALAIGGEYLADRQLARFRANPENRGQTCQVGLWRVSRHPNYFFEWLHWWAYVVMAIGAPYFALTLIGPLLMWIFIFRITGIPQTEKQAATSRPDYAAYQATTSMFIPWFPRKQIS